MLGEVAREQLRTAVGEVDPELARRLDDFEVDAICWGGAGEAAVSCSFGGLLEQRLAHL